MKFRRKETYVLNIETSVITHSIPSTKSINKRKTIAQCECDYNTRPIDM